MFIFNTSNARDAKISFEEKEVATSLMMEKVFESRIVHFLGLFS